ncbi:MAG: glycosyhydrolase, partial [Flavisolibacter sp.]|nr:glycosyhydrolase [Flavisolibacter sp.]
RSIISEVTGKPAEQTPQLWALYKEVQDYYDKGMRVPDDVTLLLCDDNWGNIRKLPKLTDKPRKGGYGIYYHFDYVGGPRNYKWLNTNNLARVWEQMHLAYAYGADKIWIVNVGDIKPMELPTSFFLDYAWNPGKWNEDNLRSYYTVWAAQQFGEKYSKEIGDILSKYSQYSARRKPELLDAATYPMSVFADADEAGRVLNEWNDLNMAAEKVNALLPADYKDAFFQLVLHPVKAMTNLHQLYGSVAWNRLYAGQNSPLANKKADDAKYYYKQDSLITSQYHTVAKGKWKHMMSQTHIGYTYWQQPEMNKMPEVKYVVQGEEGLPMEDQLTFSAKDSVPENNKKSAFYELDGIVSMEAEHWSKAVSSGNIKWKVIPGIGKTGSGITTFPVTAASQLTAASPHVEYDFYTYSTGKAGINLYFSPTLNFHNNEGLQFAVSIDDEKPTTITLNKDDNNTRTWEGWVANNIIIKKSEHNITKPGKHVLKYWMISPAVILQKLVVDFGGMKPSYLGPPETKK